MSVKGGGLEFEYGMKVCPLPFKYSPKEWFLLRHHAMPHGQANYIQSQFGPKPISTLIAQPFITSLATLIPAVFVIL